MTKTMSAPLSRASRRAESDRRRPARPLVLWHLRGSVRDLRGLAVETACGYALALEVDCDVVWLAVQPSLEYLVALADRIFTRLVARGWRVVAA